MNRNSERAMKEIRGGRYSAPSVGERLHKNSEAVYMMRARAIEEELERERNHEESSCTFQPTLIESGRFSNVKSRFHIPTERTDYRHLQERFNKNCTFTPKVRTLHDLEFEKRDNFTCPWKFSGREHYRKRTRGMEEEKEIR